MVQRKRSLPSVFISYARSNKWHIDAVNKLAAKLADDGFDVIFDGFVVGSPLEGWPRWMLNGIQRAEFVIVVCSSAYYKRFRGVDESVVGKGADWEGAAITQAIYDAKSKTEKFIPVLLRSAHPAKFVPEPLRARTIYRTCRSGDYAALVSALGLYNRPHGSGMLPSATRPEDLEISVRISVPRLPSNSGRFLGRRNELRQLSAAWRTKRSKIVVVHGLAGMGKSSLVSEWIRHRAARIDPPLWSIFEWSFRGQGVDLPQSASSERFFREAMAFYADGEHDAFADQSALSLCERGARVAARIARAGPTVLVLDGLECLQEGPGAHGGRLRDDGVATCLKNLSCTSNALCIITSRLRVSETTLGALSNVTDIHLRGVDLEAGSQILLDRLSELHGLGPVVSTAAKRRTIVAQLRGHPLALQICGRYIHDALRNIANWSDVNFSDADDLLGGHARILMRAYDDWLQAQTDSRSRAHLSLLRLTSLFDRPAEPACIDALLKHAALPWLTDALVNLSTAEWNLCVSELSRSDLMMILPPLQEVITGFSLELANQRRSAKGQLMEHCLPAADQTIRREECFISYAIDLHPLIREHYEESSARLTSDSVRRAHSLLFDHLVNSTPYWPIGPNGVAPLYQAVYHGCKAGRYDEAFHDVFLARILRDTEFYSVTSLGLISETLEALRQFFVRPWAEVSQGLDSRFRPRAYSEAAYCLRALGRMSDACEAFVASLAGFEAISDYTEASIAANCLSELFLLVGRISQAIQFGRQAVELADKIPATLARSAIHRVNKRATLADAIHQSGDRRGALRLFQCAEQQQRIARPKHPLLFSVNGARYCDALLDHVELIALRHFLAMSHQPMRLSLRLQKRLDSVRERATFALNLSTANDWTMEMALDSWLVSRIDVVLGQSNHDRLPVALTHANSAIEHAQRSSRLYLIPPILLTRAWILQTIKNKRNPLGHAVDSHALADVQTAREIAQQCGTMLQIVDCLVTFGCLFRSRSELEQSQSLAYSLGYLRRITAIKYGLAAVDPVSILS